MTRKKKALSTKSADVFGVQFDTIRLEMRR